MLLTRFKVELFENGESQFIPRWWKYEEESAVGIEFFLMDKKITETFLPDVTHTHQTTSKYEDYTEITGRNRKSGKVERLVIIREVEEI